MTLLNFASIAFTEELSNTMLIRIAVSHSYPSTSHVDTDTHRACRAAAPSATWPSPPRLRSLTRTHGRLWYPSVNPAASNASNGYSDITASHHNAQSILTIACIPTTTITRTPSTSTVRDTPRIVSPAPTRAATRAHLAPCLKARFSTTATTTRVTADHHSIRHSRRGHSAPPAQLLPPAPLAVVQPTPIPDQDVHHYTATAHNAANHAAAPRKPRVWVVAAGFSSMRHRYRHRRGNALPSRMSLKFHRCQRSRHRHGRPRFLIRRSVLIPRFMP